MEQARYFANLHEQNVFTDSVPSGVGQSKDIPHLMSVVLNLSFLVAIRTLWPEIFWSLGNMTLSNNTVKLALTEVDYKPFISLFNVTNATVTDPDISGIGAFIFCIPCSEYLLEMLQRIMLRLLL